MSSSVSICGVLLLTFSVIANSGGYKLQDVAAPPVCPDDGQHFFPDPEDCAAYYHCSFGVPHHKRCPENTYWNQEITSCDLEENVECDVGPKPTTPEVPISTTERTTTTTTTTTTPRPEPVCPPTGSISIPVPGSCQEYIRCVEGVAYPMRCPDGTLFDPIDLRCKHKDEVNCDGTPPTSVPSPTTIAPSTTTTTPRPTTKPTSEPISTPGPNPTTVDPGPTHFPGTTPDPVEFDCPATVPFIYMPHPRACTLFYWCEYGEYKGTSNCGVNLWFSFVRQACVNPWQSECDKEERPPTQPPSGSI